MITSSYTLGEAELKYEVLENGFKIYIGNNQNPTYYQYDPWIPYPGKSYEENALIMCKQLHDDYEKSLNADKPYTLMTSDYSSMKSDIDYLMLLSDPDSAAEETE